MSDDILLAAQYNDWGMEDLDDNLQALRDAGVKVSAVLGFNEPNHAEQADMSPRFRAAYAFLTPLAPTAYCT